MTKEDWDQYKDLEYYPDRVCKCGCGGRIKVQKCHKYYGIPKYINGHHGRGNGSAQQWVRNMTALLGEIFCACGCGGRMEVKSHHMHCGIPKYLLNHQKKGKPCPNMAGKNHPSWIEDRSLLTYSDEFNEEFRTLIRERDNYTCQLCGRTKEEDGRSLVVHHINHDRMNDCSDEHDFITLCRGCNRRVENKCNREYYEGFFMERNLKFKSFELPLVAIESGANRLSYFTGV